MVNNIFFCYEGETHTWHDSEKTQSFLQDKEKYGNNKKAHTDGLNIMGRKVGFAALFADIVKREALPNEASILTDKITALREIHEREDKRWVIYTDLLS